MYNLERQDIGVIERYTSKLLFWHKKTGEPLEDEYLQKLSNARDHLNKILKGTTYE